MKFIPELSVPFALPILQEETKTYHIYSCSFGLSLRVIGELNAKTIETVRSKKITEIQILPSNIKGDLDLNLLNSAPELKSVFLHVEKPIDWTPLQRLTQIQKLTLIASAHKPQPLDFTKFPHLHTARLTWHEQWKSVLTCRTLRGLEIEKSKKMEQFDLRHLPKLKELCLARCSLLQKVCCDSSQSIESLAIRGCPSFKAVEPFQVLAGLKYVVLDGRCQFPIERLGSCRKLKKLSLLGVGKIPSLRFLAHCPNIERVAMHFSTKVEDGDLTVLMNASKLRYVSFKHYRNYTHTLDEIKQHHKIPDVWMSLHNGTEA